MCTYIHTYMYTCTHITMSKLLILHIDHLRMYLDTNDSNNSATLIGAVVGVICVVILIIVISNIMIWIYCFRKRHHTGTYISSYSYAK